MPRKAEPRDEASLKKSPLTLTQLASYDNLLTDALVDHVYFWSNIRKCGARYGGTRGIHEEDIPDILRKTVIIEKNPAKATEEMLKHKAIRKIYDKLPTDGDRYHFAQHMRKYILLYMPDCPWEVSTTNRYTICTHEAAVFARRDIRKNETIKYLTGIQVPMTKQEAKELDLDNRGFSIVMSARKKTESLFLGPARFANHDCDANAQLRTTGRDGMEIIASRDIDQDEEITVSYGENYFGEDNCECLCGTCEKLVRNGWDPVQQLENMEEDDETEDSADIKGSGRTETPLSTDSEPPRRFPKLRGRRYPPRLISSDTSATDSSSDIASKKRKRDSKGVEAHDPPPPAVSSPPLQHNRIRARVLYDPFNAPETRIKYTYSAARRPIGDSFSRWVEESDDSSSTGLPSPGSSNSSRRSASTAASSVDDESAFPESRTPLSPLKSSTIRESPALPSIASMSDDEIIFVRAKKLSTPLRSSPLRNHISPINFDSDALAIEEDLKANPPSSLTSGVEPTHIDDVDADDEEQDPEPPPPKKRARGRPRKRDPPAGNPRKKTQPPQLAQVKEVRRTRIHSTLKARYDPSQPLKSKEGASGLTVSMTTETEEETTLTSHPRLRLPGDYTLAPAMARKNAGWIECTTCSRSFVQADARHLPRKECPRCERHSKLYGFAWPKTDREGKHDTEQRVLDHRTINRFLSRDELEEMRRSGAARSVRDELARRRLEIAAAAARATAAAAAAAKSHATAAAAAAAASSTTATRTDSEEASSLESVGRILRKKRPFAGC